MWLNIKSFRVARLAVSTYIFMYFYKISFNFNSFAPWCPACKNLAPVWERFAASASEINVNVAKIDVTTSPSLSGRFYVTALPTIYQ